MLRYQSDYSLFAIEMIAFFRPETKKDLATPQVPYAAIWPLSRKRCASEYEYSRLTSCSQSICAGFGAFVERNRIIVDRVAVGFEDPTRRGNSLP